MLATAPLLWVAWFYLYVLRQRLLLSFWPQPSQPNPKDAGYIIHHFSIYLGVLLVPLLTIAVIGFIIHRQVRDVSFPLVDCRRLARVFFGLLYRSHVS
jgi:hypothetical protein